MAARVTSARDRSKGKAQKPVTTSKGRVNRQGAASGRPITERGRQQRGGARVTQGRGESPKARPALPPGKPGGALARVPAPGSSAITTTRRGSTGPAPRGMRGGDSVTSGGSRVGRGTPARPALPPSRTVSAPGVPSRGPTKIGGPIKSRAGILSQVMLGVGMNAVNELMGGPGTGSSRMREAINRRISSDAQRKAEEKANPTRGGLTGNQRLANARAEQKRRKLREDAVRPPERPVATSAPQSSQPSGAGSARIPSRQNTSASAPARTPTRPSVSTPTRPSASMDENYASWTRANRKLAERVKPGQAGYAAIQKTLTEMKGSKPAEPATAEPKPRIKTQREVVEDLAAAAEKAKKKK